MVNENKHSVLAPSSKEWVHCGYSAKFLATKEEETNESSEFGTECHALAEAYIKQSLKLEDFDEEPVSIDELKSTFKHYDEEMESSLLVMQTSLLVRLIMKKSEHEETNSICIEAS